MIERTEFITREARQTADEMLLAKAPEMFLMLKKLRHAGESKLEERYCPMCGFQQGQGHANDCDLDKLIREVEGLLALHWKVLTTEG